MDERTARPPKRGAPAALPPLHALTSEDGVHREPEPSIPPGAISRIADALTEGLLLFDRAGRVIVANTAAERILRTTRGDLLGLAYDDPRLTLTDGDGRVLPPETQPFLRAREGSPVNGVRCWSRRSDGAAISLSVNATPVLDEGGQATLVTMALSDLTGPSRLEEQVRTAETRFRTLVEQIPAITYIDLVDERMTTLYISPQVEALLGMKADEWVDDPDLWYRHLHPEDRERALKEYLDGRDRGGRFSLEYRMVGRHGQVVWFHDDAVVVPGRDGESSLIHGVMLNVTERKEAEERATFLAHHDATTGLPNRSMFEEVLTLALGRASVHDVGVAVLALDLDEFRLVNENLGHAVGDELLRQVAGRLRYATRDTDVVARYGGDEFLILLSDLDRRPRPGGHVESDPMLLSAEAVVGRIKEALAPPFVLEGHEFTVTASMGVSLYPSDAENAAELLKHAEAALFRTRSEGPGRYRLYTPSGGVTVDVLSMAGRLRRAVEREQWVLHYQPIVDLIQDAIVGAEALIRWKQPNGGLVAPGEFIPLAEEMGLIEAIGEWVVQEICRQTSAWREEGLEMQVSFNLSPRQLPQRDLVYKLLKRLEQWDLPGSALVIEITESMAMGDPERTRRVLGELRGAGVRVAIDDFGTGYSSLSRLQHLGADILKVDRSFVREIPGDAPARSMVRAILEMAHGLGMEALAEGIERKDQWDWLVGQGCQFGQGFYFSRPVPAEEITEHWREEGFSSPRIVNRGEYSVNSG